MTGPGAPKSRNIFYMSVLHLLISSMLWAHMMRKITRKMTQQLRISNIRCVICSKFSLRIVISENLNTWWAYFIPTHFIVREQGFIIRECKGDTSIWWCYWNFLEQSRLDMNAGVPLWFCLRYWNSDRENYLKLRVHVNPYTTNAVAS